LRHDDSPVYDALIKNFGVDSKTAALCFAAEEKISARFAAIDAVAEANSLRVLYAMQKNKLSDSHFTSVTGYGYNDPGREAVENIYADVFNCESGLVRPQMVSGTHALTAALFGNLRHGDALLFPAGAPYDTLAGVVGMRAVKGSLAEHGVDHLLIGLTEAGGFDYKKIEHAIVSTKFKMASIQRSKGYSLRRSFSVREIGRLVSFIKNLDPKIICMVDNCYGEFVETKEPGEFGADLTVGSLIKNPGGGLSPAGGYICGARELVDACACRLTAPGLGKEVGPMLGTTAPILTGLFVAPGVVASAMKASLLASAIFDALGFATSPGPSDARGCIVQTIFFNDRKLAESFVRGVQKGSPVDCFARPTPAPMPGYDCDVIMAAGTFTQGSSIELSADAPLREPYAVYLQGGLNYHYAKLGVIIAVDYFIKENGIKIK